MAPIKGSFGSCSKGAEAGTEEFDLAPAGNAAHTWVAHGEAADPHSRRWRDTLLRSAQLHRGWRTDSLRLDRASTKKIRLAR